MKVINAGVIGWGFMGKTHTYGYKTLPFYYENLPFRVNLLGVCTRRETVAQKARDEFGFAYATTDPQQLIDDDRIDVVNICTPNNLHKDMVLASIRAGKHIYCEKPLVTNYQDAEEVLAALASSSIVTQMVHQCRFFPATLRAKELIDEGRVGRILSFRAQYLHAGSVDPDKPIGWKQDQRVCGGGVLLDLGSHLLDLIYHLLGEYQALSCATHTAYAKRPDKSGGIVNTLGDDLALITLRMKDGSIGVVEASKIATGTNDELRLEIHGDKGAIRFNLMDPNWLDFFDNSPPEVPLGGERGFQRLECVQRYPVPSSGFPTPKASIGWLRGHVHSLYNFLDAVASGTQAKPSIRDGAYIQYVMDQAYRSASDQQWVTL